MGQCASQICSPWGALPKAGEPTSPVAEATVPPPNQEADLLVTPSLQQDVAKAILPSVPALRALEDLPPLLLRCSPRRGLERSHSTPSSIGKVSGGLVPPSFLAVPQPLGRWASAEATLSGQALSGQALLESGQHPFTELTFVRLTGEVAAREAAASSGTDAAVAEGDSVCEDIIAGFGRDPEGGLAAGPVPCELPSGDGGSFCSICREEPADGMAGLFLPDTLCRRRACSGAFCRPCLSRYYTNTVEASKYAVPFIRCPSCRGFVRTSSWAACVEPSVVFAMQENAKHLLNLRCIECDQPGTLLVRSAEDEARRSRLMAEAFEGIKTAGREELCRWWLRYSAGEEEASAGLSILAGLLSTTSEDGVPSLELQRRVHGMLGLIEDTSQRAVLQLAFLRRWPKTRSSCCQAVHCFKCKVGSHHTGVTCDEVQRRQMQDESLQFCPGCGVATVKSEGCNSMICICGEEWTWEGEEMWVDDWLGQDDEDAEANAEEGGEVA